MEVGEDMSQEEGRCMMIQMKGRSLLDITMGETEQDAQGDHRGAWIPRFKAERSGEWMMIREVAGAHRIWEC